MTNGKPSAVVVRALYDEAEEPRRIDTTDQSVRGHERVVMGVMRQADLERFVIDEEGDYE